MALVSIKSVEAKKSSKTGQAHRERTIVYEGSPSPRELLEGIAIQAQAALKGLERTKYIEVEEEPTEEQKRLPGSEKGKGKEPSPVSFAAGSEENEKMSTFCNRILSTVTAIDRSLRETKGDAFVERLHASLPKVHTSSSTEVVHVDQDSSDESIKKAYVEWAKRVRFEYCDLTIPSQDEEDPDPVPQFKFYFNNEARMLANSDIPKRSLAIAKEVFRLLIFVALTNLNTPSHSLPYSRLIFLWIGILQYS